MLAGIPVHFPEHNVEIFVLGLPVQSEQEGVKRLNGRLEPAVGSWTRKRVDLVIHLESGVGGGEGTEEGCCG